MNKVVLAAVAGLAASVALAQESAPRGPVVVVRPASVQPGVDARDEQAVLRYNVENRLHVDVTPLIAAQKAAAERAGDNRSNGRPFAGREVSASSSSADPRDSGAAAAHGAAGSEGAVILVHVGHRYTVAINPFEPVGNLSIGDQKMPMEVRKTLEEARQRWLKDNGFTGGVRTFTNAAAPAEAKSAKDIKPRGVIELSPEATKFKKRMQVRSNTGVKVAPKVVRFVPTTSTGGEDLHSTHVASVKGATPRHGSLVKSNPIVVASARG